MRSDNAIQMVNSFSEVYRKVVNHLLAYAMMRRGVLIWKIHSIMEII